jgi:signal peptidase I
MFRPAATSDTDGHGKGGAWRVWLIGHRPRRTLVRALGLAVLAYLFFGHVMRPVIVRGRSMEPTIRDGAVRLAHLWMYRRRDPRRGEIVVIRMTGRRMMLLKRVLAVPHDRIRFDGGALWLNGERYPEPYVVHRGNWTTAEYQLEPDEYYVAGDNRAARIEDHDTGIAERERLVGGIRP